ncbi:MAG TPA: hypothetical protein PK011_01870 [Marinagarivorans sp.]|nr:hypothetical protein [Cellvibrionaceae bacterium]HMY38047.1 hypothetical protein [Marinagarivorans sp.]HNG61465.1 hypothetical protein [Cellvibrionaceae bacterium]
MLLPLLKGEAGWGFWAGASKEVLTLNLVTNKTICPLASVSTSKNPKANQQVRDLIDGQFAQTSTCPTSITKL